MAKDKKVEQITDMEVDFAQWFTDVCKKAQLIDYSTARHMGLGLFHLLEHLQSEREGGEVCAEGEP